MAANTFAGILHFDPKFLGFRCAGAYWWVEWQCQEYATYREIRLIYENLNEDTRMNYQSAPEPETRNLQDWVAQTAQIHCLGLCKNGSVLHIL